jgi:hypothetical protein
MVTRTSARIVPSPTTGLRPQASQRGSQDVDPLTPTGMVHRCVNDVPDHRPVNLDLVEGENLGKICPDSGNGGSFRKSYVLMISWTSCSNESVSSGVQRSPHFSGVFPGFR